MKKNVAILVFDDVEILDFCGPFEVFALTDELQNHTAFHTFIVALAPGSVRARNGLKLVPDFTPENCPVPDILVIPGGAGTRPLLQKIALLEWLRKKSRGAEIVLSICTRSTRAGQSRDARWLAGYDAPSVARAASIARADRDRRWLEAFHDSGRIITAGGISAGIDASLYVVERLLGRGVKEATMRSMEYGPDYQALNLSR